MELDEVAKRREARRRKILQNSQNRLNRISGIENKSTASPPILENFASADCIQSEHLPHDDQPQEQKIVQQAQNDESLTQPVKSYKRIVICGLAAHLQLCFILLDLAKVNIESTHINKIFVAFFALKVFDYFLFPKEKSESKSKSILHLILIANLKNHQLLSVLRALEVITSVMQDMMFYFFVFVCCELVKHVVTVH